MNWSYPERGGTLPPITLSPNGGLEEVAVPSGKTVCFGVFDLNLRAGELRKQGVKIKLQEQPFQILQILLERPGEVVTREELQKHLWPAATFVDFEHGLYNAVKRLREALGDTSETPRYIETLPKRGYRFIGPVNGAATGESFRRTLARRWSLRALTIPAGAIVLLAMLLALNVGNVRGRLFSAASAPPIRSLAVLPLQNLSSDPAQEYFSDGMTDALITDLAQIGSVKVISRTSSMQYKQTKKSLPEIARELNVDGIVEGTVQRSGDRVRITAQLIHGPSDKHLWADTYERDMRDVFALERDLTGEIAREVRARVTTQNQAVSGQPRAVNLTALEAYLQGEYHLQRAEMGVRDEELRKAGEYFQHAIEVEPAFTSAYIGFAEAHHNLWWPSSEDFPLMKGAAEKALQLAPTSSDAHEEIALTKWEDWDWLGAEEEHRRAIALNPNNAVAHHNLGDLLDALGRLEEGWKEHEIAQELDPIEDHLSWGLYRRGDYDHSIELLLKTVERRPQDGVMHWLLSQNYLQKGMYKEWVAEFGNSMTLLGSLEIDAHVTHAFDTSGYRSAMRQLAREGEQLVATKQIYFPGWLAQVYTTLGDKERAFYWLQEGCDHHYMAISDPTLQWLKIDPGFAPLRSDPRFKDLLRRVGLPP